MTQGTFYLEDEDYDNFKLETVKEKSSMTEKIQGWVKDYLEEKRSVREPKPTINNF